MSDETHDAVKVLAPPPLIYLGFLIVGKGAASIMATNGIKRLLLFKGDEMAGVITARDLVEANATA